MSSYLPDISCCPIEGYCDAVSRGLAGVNGVNNTSFKATPVGVLQLLFDPTNREQAEYVTDINDSNGAVRRIRVKRIPRATEEDAVDIITCDSTTVSKYVEQCVTVNKEASISFEVTKEEMQRYCAAELAIQNEPGATIPLFQDHLNKILAVMNGLRERINAQITATILSNIGINVVTNSATPFPLPMLYAANGGKVEKGIQLLEAHLAENEVYGQYLIAGAGIFDRFNTSIQYGCCNQFGINWDAMNAAAPYRYYRDFKLRELTGNPDIFLVFAPGAVQFVYYNDTILGRLDGQRHGNTLYGTMIDPLVPGLRYDVAIEETNCDGVRRAPKWIVTLYLNFDVVFIPDNAYKPGDRLRPAAGTSNGVFQFIATEI